MKTHKIDFINIPSPILYNPNLRDKEKLLLGLIQNLPKGLMMSNADIAEALCTSTRTVTELITSLASKGYAKATGRSGKYRKIKVEESCDAEDTTSQSDVHTSKSDVHTSKSDVHTSKSASTTTKENTKEEKRTTTDDDDISLNLKNLFKKGYASVLELAGGDVTLLNDAVEYAKAKATGSVTGYARRLLENGWRPDAETPAEHREAERKQKADGVKYRREEKEQEEIRRTYSSWVKEATADELSRKMEPKMMFLFHELRPEIFETPKLVRMA